MTTQTEPPQVSKRERYSLLPPGCPPRGYNREAAAQHIGVGVSKFDEMVADGRMPQPKKIDSRKVWDRVELEAAFVALPVEAPGNEWDALV